MFVVETQNYLHGPFKTAAAAVKWAEKELALCKWAVRKLTKP